MDATEPSRFGLSFDKEFIAASGGAPIHYLPREANVSGFLGPSMSKAEYFDRMVIEYHKLFKLFDDLIMKNRATPGVPPEFHRVQEVRRFLSFHIFSYMKFFDHRLPDEHEENYYFEREWRIAGNLSFGIEDVRRILIPEEYAERFRQDCPKYCGQLSFV